MKKIMSMALLATLASCGGSGGSGNGGNNIENIQDAVLSVERGLVSIQSTKGTVHHYEGDVDGNYTVKVVPVKSDEYSVILKVDGTKIYKYVEDRDLLEGTVDKSVEMEEITQESLDEVLKLPGANLSGNILTLNMTDSSDFELGDNAVATSKHTIRARIDLANYHCSSTFSTRVFDVRLTQNGVTTKVPESGAAAVTKCEAAWSADQLKALDLSAITFCEDSTTEEDERDCEERDMEFLTDDL